ncbi:glutamate receptor ionotropic, NMDA 3A-like [Saccostrea cucullata]|uniref:glutamate receptor ionotropic, NMDA 3A-like n=1 Tax=Saccostrea cuccullata TaxID=36930 RepID=UPI002ECFFDF0
MSVFLSCILILLSFVHCSGNDIVAIIDQDIYNLHFRTFYLSVERPEINLTGVVYPTYTGLDDQLHGLCSYLTQHQTRAVLVIGTQQTINIVSMVANVLGIPTLAYMKDAKTVYEKTRQDLLLILGHSHEETARAVLTFFRANFWYRFLIITEDQSLNDGFFGKVISQNQTELWHVSLLIVSRKATPEELRRQICRVLTEDMIVLLHVDPKMAILLFTSLPCKIANQSNIIKWFLTEKVYTQDTSLLKFYPASTLAIVKDGVMSLDDVISDSVSYLNFVIHSARRDGILPSAFRKTCFDESLFDLTYGERFYRHFKETTYQGFSVLFDFTPDGYLTNQGFKIKALKNYRNNTVWKEIGYVQGENVRPRGILWPLQQTLDLQNGRVRYRVVTNPVKPFIMVDDGIEDTHICIQSTRCIKILVADKNQTLDIIQNFENNNDTIGFELKCCRGFAIDLLNKLSSDLEFEFVLYIVHDTTYGKKMTNGSWDGMVRDLTNGIADMAIAAFSITGSRMSAIDFSYPYYFSRFTVLYIQQNQKTYMYAFIEPFSVEVWCTIFISATISAVGMSMFEWNSPFGLNPWGRKRKQNYTLGSGMTMVYSLLFGHTVSTKSPKSWPSKVLQNFWASACIFIIASYTANLAAFLAGKHSGIDYSSVFDSRLMEIRVGVLGGSAVEALTSNVSKALYIRSQNHLVPTTNDAIDMLINGKIDAYLGDYPILDYARVKLDPNCNLYIVPQSFGEDEYGIGFPKGSPLQKPVSEKIKHYHDSGYLENLIDIHFDEEKCFNQGINEQRFSLNVSHHSGLFALLSIAIVCCILLVLVEHLVFKYLLPICRRRPGDSFWKSLSVMFFSQRLHRSINSAVLISAQESAKEMLGIVKKGDFSKLFMKSTIRKNKLADLAKTKRINRNFLDIVEKAKWVSDMKSTSLIHDDSPIEPVDIKRISLRNLSNCVNLEALRSQCQRSLPKVDSVRNYDDSNEECSDSEAEDTRTLSGLENTCKVGTSDSKYDMWYVPGKHVAGDSQSNGLPENSDTGSYYERHLDEAFSSLHHSESSCSCDTCKHEALGACYGGGKEEDFCEVSSSFSGKTKSDFGRRVATSANEINDFHIDDNRRYENIDEETGLLHWNESEENLKLYDNDNYRPHSMQTSQPDLNKSREHPTRARNNPDAESPNVHHLSKRELLQLWKSSELQLNYLLKNTLRENIELKNTLAKLQGRSKRDTKERNRSRKEQ